ncbi:hypothetical protein P691DRAFT_757271 [Macrolepiota fuliginosa MF-IS2]|uniref:DUF6533 domain-containing protein n=1 Tax=Macrolepiota fuliginosa MF-IS2 TaxID=1400762 RepID=A0A9P5XJC0_9AGAR|nr:hypothetical protein P691DRAFT_757271 [Macrolepiota fuliginosa MF-IS2]
MQPDSSEKAELVITAVKVVYLQHYCQLAGSVITFYDHFLNFNKELELVWVSEPLPPHIRQCT